MSDSSSDAVSAAYMPRIDHVRKARETNDYQQYLYDVSAEARPDLTINSVKKIGEGDWEERSFWDRLREVLSDEVCLQGPPFMRLLVIR